MRTVAEKPMTTQQAKSPTTTVRARSHFGHGHQENSILHLPRTIRNQAVQSLPRNNAEELNAVLGGAKSPRFGHDFSRIPVNRGSSGALQTKLAVNTPGDDYEQEAERAAASFDGGGHHADKISALSSGASGSLMYAPPIVEQAPNRPGVGLDLLTRAAMEAHFGHRFDDVRVHTDAKAAEAARSVDALAYTVGRHVVAKRCHAASVRHFASLLIPHLIHPRAWPN